MDRPAKILVLKPSSLGDVIHAFPAVALLRAKFPDAAISWLVNEELAGIVELFPAVDEIIPFRRGRWGKPWFAHELMGHIWQLRRAHFDVTLDFQGLFRSGFLSFSSGARRRIGFRRAREGAPLFYSERIDLPAAPQHAVDRNTALVQQAFALDTPAAFPALLRKRDTVKRVDDLWNANGLNRGEPVLAVAPATRWPSKMWPAEYFARVLDLVGRAFPHLACWLVGTRAERPVGDELVRACIQVKPHNLMGETGLGELLEMLRRSDVLLTNDSGPMHLAAGLRRPTVALFGPTDPVLTGPYGSGHVVFQGNCPQGPCFQENCRLAKRQCVHSVSPEAVATAIIEACRAGTGVLRHEKVAPI